MPVLDLPADLVSYYAGRKEPTLDAAHYGTVSLIPLDRLKVETLEVTPNLAPFVSTHPHADEYGHYAVPAVNLIQSQGDREHGFPACLFLCLPNEKRYGSYDLDHGDLMVFDATVSWSDIAASPSLYVSSSDGGDDGEVSVTYFEPWPRYPFVEVEMPD